MTQSPVWAAQRSVDPARAAALVAGAFPWLRDQPVVLLAEGWDNAVYVVGGQWAVRFPRRSIAVPGIRRQVAVLPRIAALLPVPVPVPELVAADDDPVEPWPFIGARLIPGRELAECGRPGESRTDAATAVGAFLKALHAPATRRAVADVELPVDPFHRTFPRAPMPHTREQLRRLAADGLWQRQPAVDRLLEEAERLDEPTGDPVLVHGDLHLRHVLLDDAGRVTGVIDWDDLSLADPAADLALGYMAFSGPTRAALFTAYGPVDVERELRARALAIRICAILAVYAAAERRPRLLAAALAGLHRATE